MNFIYQVDGKKVEMFGGKDFKIFVCLKKGNFSLKFFLLVLIYFCLCCFSYYKINNDQSKFLIGNWKICDEKFLIGRNSFIYGLVRRVVEYKFVIIIGKFVKC